jgi:teichuronic acid exporter
MEGSNLRKSVVSGVSWTFANQIGTQLITLLVGIILARLITPSEY